MEMTDEQMRARYSAEFKQDAFSRMGQRGKTVTALAEELGGSWAEVFILVARTVAGWRQGGAGARQGKAAREQIEISFYSQPSVQLSCGSQNWSGC